MATIMHGKTSFVVKSGDRFLQFTDGQRKQFQLPKAQVDQQKDAEGERQDVTKTDSENYVLAAGFSTSGGYFAVADNDKQLHLYKTAPDLELVSTRPLQRRCTALTFTNSESDVIVADRTGDVYRFSLEKPHEDGELLLGHLSMILDVKLTKDDQYIVTSDRDEKVRISHYPNAYNVHAYCLFHTEYVSQILIVPQLNCLISGSGDGRLATWTVDGQRLDCTEDVKVISEDSTKSGNHDNKEENTEESIAGVKKIVYDDTLNLLAVIYYRCRTVSLYSLNEDLKVVKLEKQSEVDLREEPWDISWSHDHRLWVLEPCEENTVTVYKCQRDPQTSEVSICKDEEGYKDEVDFLNSSWDFFKESLKIQGDTVSLQKLRTYDNMKRYLERKEERIKGEKGKKTNKDSPSEEIAEKRLKIS